MNIFQFIASLTGSLVWPIVVILTVVLLRKSISHIILSLQKLRLNYKEKDIELDFGERFEEIEAAAKRANIPELTQESKISSEIVKVEVQTEESDKLKALQEDLEKRFRELENRRDSERSEIQPRTDTKRVELELQKISLEVEKQRVDLQRVLDFLKLQDAQFADESVKIVAENGPIGAIVLSWSQLQAEIMSIVSPLWRGTHFPSIKEAIRDLKRIAAAEKRPFENETLEILENLRILRNETVHNIDETKITFAEALEYVRLTQRMLALLKPLQTAVQEVNLATLAPNEFELLMQELFSKVFAEKKGILHRMPVQYDKGFDAIGIDPDPIKGGKILIQIKKYRRPVSTSSIRDLAGAMQLEGATKGILVTTSTFSEESIKAAKGMNIELIDGSHLLDLLKRYGYKAKIEYSDNK